MAICIFCGRRTDENGYCTNEKCPDYKRKLLIEKDKKAKEANNTNTNNEVSTNKA